MFTIRDKFRICRSRQHISLAVLVAIKKNSLPFAIASHCEAALRVVVARVRFSIVSDDASMVSVITGIKAASPGISVTFDILAMLQEEPHISVNDAGLVLPRQSLPPSRHNAVVLPDVVNVSRHTLRDGVR